MSEYYVTSFKINKPCTAMQLLECNLVDMGVEWDWRDPSHKFTDATSIVMEKSDYTRHLPITDTLCDFSMS